MTLSIPVTEGLLEVGLDPDDTERVVRGALAEDLRYGPDVTSAATATAGARAVAGVVAREPGVLAGLPVALAVLDAIGVPPEAAEPRHADGDRIAAGAEVLRIRSGLRELLGAERTLLNLLTHLSGIATATRVLGGRPVGYRLRGPRHPEDHPGAASAGEVCRPVRRRPEPPHGPRRRRADQGQPRGGRGQRHQGH